MLTCYSSRSSCSGIVLIPAFHLLHKLKDKIKTEDIVDGNLESFELEMEVDKDALAQPPVDGFLQGMDSKIQVRKKYALGWLAVRCK